MPDYPMESGPKAWEKFLAALRKIVSVPKSEIDRREREYQANRKRKQTPS